LNIRTVICFVFFYLISFIKKKKQCLSLLTSEAFSFWMQDLFIIVSLILSERMRAKIEYFLMMSRDFVATRKNEQTREEGKTVVVCFWLLSRWNVMIWLSVSVVRSSLFFSNMIRINKTLAHFHHSFPHDVYKLSYPSMFLVCHRFSTSAINKMLLEIQSTYIYTLWHSMNIDFSNQNHK